MSPNFDISHLAKLAELHLDEDQKVAFSADLALIFGHIHTLQSVDVAGVDPSAHAEELLSPLRPDQSRPSQSQAAALSNAPQTSGGQFIVPRVIGAE